MDPLTAIGLAANIVQFVDFCSKLVSVTREIHTSVTGTTAENSDLNTVIGDLSAVTERLRTSTSQQLTAEEKSLHDLASNCRALSRELLGRLNELNTKSSNSRLKSFRVALANMKSRGELESIMRRLDSYRNEILLKLNIMLSAEQSRIGWRLENLIVEARRLESNMADEFVRTRMAIKDCIRDHSRHEVSEILNSKQQTIELIQCGKMLATLAEEGTKVSNGQRIMRNLRFESMRVRHQNIERAHVRTFQWILEDEVDTGESHSGSTFKNWLSFGDGIYYISGKAGSGKSTLMKFISDNPSTRMKLQAWAHPKTLLFAPFFFWNAGTNLQKSHEGLLRTLLYEILRLEPGLIPKIFPDHWGTAENSPMNISEDQLITYSDVLTAFDCLIRNDDIRGLYRFCFFIDGLDEYAGDHKETIKLLKSWTQSDNIKICFSSRPWNIFEDHFSSKQKLRLQDLTRSDIELYVRDELESDQAFKGKEDQYQHLVTRIVDKADGVFLWVYLVTRSLRDDLGNAEQISFLEQRVDALPTGLIPYFNHILETIDPLYRQLTARMFLVATLATQPLSMLTYSLLDDIEEDPEFAMKAPVRPYTVEEVQNRHEQTRRRLDGRCKGLLEINEDPSADFFFKYRVDFLHRTVREFLKTDEVQEALGSRFNNFDAERSLCHAYLAQVKFVPTKGAYFLKCDSVYDLVDNVIFWARQKEIKSRMQQVLIMVALEEVLIQHRRRPFSHPDEWLENPGWIAWNPSQVIRDGEHFSLVDFAASHGVYGYVSWKLSQSPDLIQEEPDSSLLSYALGITEYPSQHRFRLNPQLVHLLLEQATFPTQMWTEYIQSLKKKPGSGALNEPEWLIIESFLKFGANPDVYIDGTSLSRIVDISLPDNIITIRRLLQRNGDGMRNWTGKIAGSVVLGLISAPFKVGQALLCSCCSVRRKPKNTTEIGE